MSVSIAPPHQLHWIEGESLGAPPPVVSETGLLREALRLLGRHKLLLVAVFLAVAVAGASIGYMLPPVYKASSTVLIGMSRKEAVTSREVLSDIPMDSEAVASELELLDSRELLERVCDRLKLLQDPEFNASLRPSRLPAALEPLAAFLTKWRNEILPPAPAAASRPMNDVVDAFRRQLTVAPVGRSRAIRITFASRNPDTAAAVVNTLADVYTDEHLRLRDDATREANDWISQRIVELRTRADQSARVVDQYQAEHGLVRGRDSMLIQQELSELSTQLTTARAHRMEADATLSDVQQAITSGRPERVATVLNSPLIQRLREQESLLTARRADIESRAGAAYPSAVAAAAELRDVQARIAAEVGRIVQSVRDQQKIAQANENALTTRMGQIRAQVDQANTQNVGLQERQREADADNALYQTFLTRSKETEPEFNFPTVNVRVLSRAVPPEHPASPNKLLIALASLVVGLVAGCAAIFAKDSFAGGVRSRGDVERLIGAAPLGTIPFLRRPARPQEQARLDEAVSSLWARLMASPTSPRPRSLVITSALLQEGKTTLSRLLGLAAADRGQRVLLVDADLRCSSLTTNMMGRNPRLGLAEIIRGEATAAAVTVRYGSNLDIVPAGECRGSPVRLLTSEAFTAFLRRAEADYDLVIIDSPPVLIGADAWLLACNAQATLMLARWGHTPPSAIMAALKQFSDVRVKCLGVVMSLVDTSKHAQYDEAASLARSRQARRYYAKLVAPQ